MRARAVVVLELLSAKSRRAKATKTERHDESLHARNSICHVCLRCTALLQRSSALPLDHKQEQHLAGSVCVCMWNATSICHVCAAQRCFSAVEPCLSTTGKSSTWPEVCVRVECNRPTEERH